MFKKFSSHLYFVLILFEMLILLCFGGWFYGFLIRSYYNEFVQYIELTKNKVFMELVSRCEEIKNTANRLRMDNYLKVSLELGMEGAVRELIKRESIPQRGIYVVVSKKDGSFVSDPNTKFLVPIIKKHKMQDKITMFFVEPYGLFCVIKSRVRMRSNILGCVYVVNNISQDNKFWNIIKSICPFSSILWYEEHKDWAWDVRDKIKVKRAQLIEFKDFYISVKNIFYPHKVVLSISKKFPEVFLVFSTKRFVLKIKDITNLIIFSCMTIIIATFLIVYLLIKRISSPINYLRNKCVSISKNLSSEFLDVNSLKHLEFRELAESFNKVLASFLSAQRKLQQWAEEQIDLSEKKYQTLIDVSPIGIASITQENEFILFNPYVLKITGYSYDEMKNINFLSLFAGEEAGRIEVLKNECGDGLVRSVETRILSKHEGFKWIELYLTKISERENAYLVILLDITKRKQVEEEKRVLVSIVEQVPEAIILADKTTEIQYINPAFTHTFGYTSEDVKKRKCREFWEDQALCDKILNFVLKGGTWSGYTKDIRKDGEQIDTFTIVSPLKVSDHEVEYVLLVKKDVSQQMKLEREISRVQKLQAIGTLAGGIAHDFNNILTGIMGYLQIAMARLSEKDIVYSYLQKCWEGSLRAKDLISQILTFSRSKEEKREPIFLSPIVKEAVKFFTSTLPPNIKLVQQIKDESLIIEGNATQVYQILVNLITNSAYAMKDKGGEVVVTLDKIKLDVSHWMVEKRLLLPGDFALIIVKDTGVGIELDVLERVFEPFFTTKPKGEGTGMGLAVVHGIVKSYNGFVHIESEVGKGTVVYVYLPLYERGFSQS